MLTYSPFLIICTIVWSTVAKNIPSYVHLCSRNDPGINECFVNTIKEIMPHLLQGIPEMNIPPVDPLSFTSVSIHSGSTKSVSLDADLLDGIATGFKDLEIKDHRMDFDKIRFSAILHLPRIGIEANYKMNGKILLFELNGGGRMSLNVSDILVYGVWTGATYTKDDKKHININKVEFSDVKLKNIKMRLDNLFADNQALTDTVNNAINNNIESLQEEIQPIVLETMAEIIKNYFNRVYRLFPMDQLYPIE